MIITFDEYNMGYIYLTNPSEVFDVNEVKQKSTRFTIIRNNELESILQRLPISSQRYLEALENKEFEEQFYNDFISANEHLEGIEFRIKRSELINDINSGAFKTYLTEWKEQTFQTTFSHQFKISRILQTF